MDRKEETHAVGEMFGEFIKHGYLDAGLNETQMLVAFMRTFGSTFPEIGEELGMSASSASSVMTSANDKVQEVKSQQGAPRKQRRSRGKRDFAFNPSNDEIARTQAVKFKELPRPDYTLLWRKAQNIVTTRHAPPLTAAQRRQWADTLTALDDMLLPLTSDYSGSVMAPTGDIKTEQRLVDPALAKTHDFLKLYQTEIKQPPPDDLELIEQVLRYRRDSLQSLHPG